MMMNIVHRSIMDDTMGAAFVGVVIAAILHGVSCVQAWFYYTNQQDGWSIKALVGFVFLFDTIHQILITHSVYYYLVTEYGNPAALSRLVWSLSVEVIFNGLTALLVQCFLTMRVWRLSNRNIPLTLTVLSLVLAEFACVFAYTIKSLGCETYAELAPLKPLSITVNALAAAGDVLIAGSLCILLHRSRTGFQRSDTIINKLILFAVNTGLLTSICAVASLVSITVAPNTFYYIAFFFCIGRLYSNSIFATLNARKAIRNASENFNNSNSLGNLPFSLNESPGVKGMPGRPIKHAGDISIKIDTTKAFTIDGAGDRSSKGSGYPFKETDV